MKRRDEVLVGLLSTAAVVAGIMGTLWLARGGLSPGYPLYSKFAWGAGLKQGQPVLLSGVSVGFVKDVAFLPDGHLVVEYRVRSGYNVPRGTTATIQPNGFFGDQLIALKPAGPSGENYTPGDTIPSGPGATQLGDVLAQVDTITREVAKLTKALNKQFVDDGGMGDLRKAVANANTMISTLTRVAEAQSKELTTTQQSLRRLTNAVDSAKVSSTIASMSEAAKSVESLTTELKSTTARLSTTLDKLNEGQGSAAKLMNDAGMYNDVRGLVQRLDSLTADFKKNPKKYVKLSIF
jgi:phospholipid/cholesterol/gamma-HCH transport system substrate-binding protein